ncbi:type III secretion system chaperone [Chlamydia pecorum]|uniref:Tir chaperone protein (CesT) n=2 Tax=Chlamydia pecorum TaxID=85991 RepID=A0AA34RCQ9_CHLPE|nr:type III secretion system chaperone [Chlamydia pecorum]AEB41336.1 Tir chaperone protein (CesT) [Chlamydia pecorum E58]AGW37542.1 putative chaperone protein [Chlamydia pecorum PV3056/3]AGW38463.1 putative chaperone protein [Chlamydia pecorum W73]AGW39388.1 putative chaperone protein [Chlamydia pecorum P787]ETF38686.1 Tir chaperone protein CesT [Chlamydia pecorum VR629]
MLEKLIKNFATYMGITSTLEFDADGAYVLPIGEVIKVRVQQNADSDIVLSTSLGTLPPSADTKKIYLQMMVANFLGRETGGSSLGLDPEGQIMMIRKFSGEVSPEDFARHIECFMNFSEAWLEDLGLNSEQKQ